MKAVISLSLAALLLGCASYDGRGLVPGQSTAAEVEKVMGAPKEKLPAANGEAQWFYPTAPYGRDTYAARIAPDGRLLAWEQRLTRENLDKVVAGTPANAMRELLGPPWRVTLERDGSDVWDYPVLLDNRLFDFYVYVKGGAVQRTLILHDPIYDGPCPC